MFKFRKEVRPFVESLANLLYFANAQNAGKWAWQTSGVGWEGDGVFGTAYNAILCIIREECGEWVAKDCNSEGFNFGGNGTFLDDIETLIGEVMKPRYAVHVVCEGNSWYAHTRGERIDNEETAMRFTKPEAEATAEHYRKAWNAHASVIDME